MYMSYVFLGRWTLPSINIYSVSDTAIKFDTADSLEEKTATASLELSGITMSEK